MGLSARLPDLMGTTVAIIGHGAIARYVRAKLPALDISEIAEIVRSGKEVADATPPRISDLNDLPSRPDLVIDCGGQMPACQNKLWEVTIGPVPVTDDWSCKLGPGGQSITLCLTAKNGAIAATGNTCYSRVQSASGTIAAGYSVTAGMIVMSGFEQTSLTVWLSTLTHSLTVPTSTLALETLSSPTWRIIE